MLPHETEPRRTQGRRTPNVLVGQRTVGLMMCWSDRGPSDSGCFGRINYVGLMRRPGDARHRWRQEETIGPLTPPLCLLSTLCILTLGGGNLHTQLVRRRPGDAGHKLSVGTLSSGLGGGKARREGSYGKLMSGVAGVPPDEPGMQITLPQRQDARG